MKFVADSSCDMAVFPGVDFTAVPLTISTDEREFIDGEALDVDAMLTYLENYKGRSYTACPSSDAWLQAFGSAKEIFVITITSGLSGTYNSANVAKDMYLHDHPDAKIYVIDSLSTGPGMRLILEKLVEMDKNGVPFEEMCTRIEEYKDGNHLYFGLQSISNLAKNGRVNKLLASAVGMLGISILGTASKEGTIESVGKSRGDRRLVKDTLKAMKSVGYHGGKVRINNVVNPSISEALKQAVLSEFPDADVICYPSYGLTGFYAERNGFILGCECQ
jgi:DegV family protein with EDD domain